MKNNILLIGPYSTVGGVSIHIKRLSKLLESHFKCLFIDESPITAVKNEVFNLRSFNLYNYFKLIYKSDCVHIHSGLWWLRLFHITVSRGLFRKKTILTIHSLTKSNRGIPFFITKLCARLASLTIVVSQEIFVLLDCKKAIIKPAFIPPDLKEEEQLPIEVLKLIDSNKQKKLIVGNAFKLLTHNGLDLYGLDLLLKLAMKFKRHSIEHKIIFVIASVTENDSLFKKYTAFIEKNSLEAFITIIPYKIPFFRLILRSDLVVRPTCSDGDALTIREALFLEKPVIASDVVIRPKKTILFKNRDIEDLYLKVIEVLSNKKTEVEYFSENSNNFETLKLEYRKIYE